MEVEQENPKYPTLFSSIQLGRDCIGSDSPKTEPGARVLDLVGERSLKRGSEGSRTG